jgi:type IV pilus biogenesis protein PilP
MSRIKAAISVLLFAWQAGALAVTFEQLAQKNARLIELKADLALAKAETELADARNKGQASATANVEKVPAIQVLPKTPPAPAPTPVPKAVPQEEVAEAKALVLMSIHGKMGSLVADFQYGDTTLSRRVGDRIQDNWQIVRIAFPGVVMKRTVDGKEQCRVMTMGGVAPTPTACQGG